MASLAIHLLVAQEYLKKNNKEKEKKFIEGNIAPDLFADKAKSHYGPITAKPNLSDFLDNNQVEDSYYRGYFLHLLTDYLFYNYLIDIDKVVEQIGVDNFGKKLYNDYDAISSKVANRITVEIPEKIKKFIILSNNELELFKEKDLFDFITNLSDINIDEFIESIMKDKNIDIITLFKTKSKQQEI